jgi:2-oxoisovalerate dehydrogenase E1 component alpha subunit
MELQQSEESLGGPPRPGSGTWSSRDLYRAMARVRALNDDAMRMQRQSLLLGFAPCAGQEAAQVGSAAAVDPSLDFVFQTYRELGVAVTLGVPPAGMLAHYRGLADGGGYDSAAAHVAPLNSVVGGTALHAVGWAMGAKLDGSTACAVSYFGDGASSQGEVHEAMNFAGVFVLPVIFFCQNNGWAISVPVSAQVGGGSIAARATGYGLAGVSVDGNDVRAVYDVMSEAVARARSGGGATLIEAMTYRLGPHATSDDTSRYRTLEEEASWSDRDPLVVERRRLLESGEADDGFFDEVEAEANAEAERVREEVALLVPPTVDEQFGLAYERTPPSAAARVRDWIDELRDV